jgi:hypothetical protein
MILKFENWVCTLKKIKNMENSTKNKIINIGLPFLFLMLVWGSSFILVKHGQIGRAHV